MKACGFQAASEGCHSGPARASGMPQHCSFSGSPQKARRTRRNAQSSISRRMPRCQRTVQGDLKSTQTNLSRSFDLPFSCAGPGPAPPCRVPI